MNKVLNRKGQARTKTSAVNLLLVDLMGERCQLYFKRQDELFEGVLRINDADWICGASFKPHWVLSLIHI